MDSVKQASNFVNDKIQEASSGASKEANKNVAKDGDASMGTRAAAAKDALENKVDESQHAKDAQIQQQK